MGCRRIVNDQVFAVWKGDSEVDTSMGLGIHKSFNCPDCGGQLRLPLPSSEGNSLSCQGTIRQVNDKLDRLEALITRNQSPWRTVPEVAKQLGITDRTVRRYYKSGKLKSHKTPSGSIRLNQNDVDAWMMFGRSYRKLTRPQKDQLRELCR